MRIPGTVGDPTKAREKLGWRPRITFEELVHEMVEADLQIARRDRVIVEAGFRAYRYYE